MIPHEPIRQDLIEVNYLLKNNHLSPEEVWKFENFFEWYESRFKKSVVIHHDTEEHVFFPAIRKRCAIPEKTTADHKQLIAKLNEISQVGNKFKTERNENAANACLATLTTNWNDLVELMFPHLAEEEEQMKTQIKERFSEKEFEKVVQSIIKKEGLGNARINLPGILQSMSLWATEQFRQDFIDKLPKPIRYLLFKYWKPSFDLYHRGALISLRKGAPKQIIKESEKKRPLPTFSAPLDIDMTEILNT